MRDGDPNGGGEPGRRPRRRSGAWLAALLVAAAIGGAVAVSAPGAADLPGNASDGTVTTDATWGTAVEVADVRYATAGTVASVRIDLGRGAAASGVSPDDVSAVDVVLYNDTEGVLAGVNGTAYDDQPTNVSVGRPVAGVDRIRIVATVATTAEGGNVIDAEYAVLDGDGNRRPWQSTAGRQPIVEPPGVRIPCEAPERHHVEPVVAAPRAPSQRTGRAGSIGRSSTGHARDASVDWSHGTTTGASNTSGIAPRTMPCVMVLPRTLKMASRDEALGSKA